MILVSRHRRGMHKMGISLSTSNRNFELGIPSPREINFLKVFKNLSTSHILPFLCCLVVLSMRPTTPRNLLLVLFLSMLSSFGARAFATTKAAQRAFTATRPSLISTARFMSSEPDTSVVETCTQKIGAALETDNVKVTGAYDDPNGSHIAIEVVSEKFEGKRAMQRQQMVYKAIWDELQGPVHAGE